MNAYAIYIHVPYCRRRCPYCDFYFVVNKPHKNFAHALLEEWDARSSIWLQGPALSLYFGGGTPSLLAAQEIELLLEFFKNNGALNNDAEITIEANPEDITSEYIKSIKRAGVNRVSLGVQSFHDPLLKILGRKHSGDQAKKAIETILTAGIENISVDMILGVPKEIQEATLKSIDYLVEKVPHISTYLLTIEEGTHFYKKIQNKKMAEPNEDTQVEIYRLVQEKLCSANFIQYDISSYARDGFFSRHNQVYWGLGSYIGLGPSAHSMRFLEGGGICRAHNSASLEQWLLDPKSDLCFKYDQLNAQDALKESLAFGLRNMKLGINPKKLAERHQQQLPQGFFKAMQNMLKNGWLEEKNEEFFISQQGALFADAIMREILCC
ncbi:MAG: radical SAM family heme chaperone HemW [Myxococcales bacterium]|nr:radical SAM family heme chaperone HemW [Myxococcales bacterium]USN51781.1 MAG: radical SAM family heme chaperone HemW [Myxococcales bacterium]